MEKKFNKKDNSTLTVIDTITTTRNYKYDELLRERIDILNELETINKMLNDRLSEIEMLIKEADKLGIKLK